MTTYDCNELKKRLVETTNFAEFQDYFFTNFIETGPFMAMGRSLSAPRSEFLVEAVAEAYYRVTNTRLAKITAQFVEVRELGLIHGAFSLNDKKGSILYFEDLEMGMVTVVENFRTGETKYMRFTAHRPTPNKPS